MSESEQTAQETHKHDQPLLGWRVVITRSEEQADTLAERLQALGAEPVLYPTIMVVPPDDLHPLDDALQRLMAGAYDWLVLTSVNAVNAVHARLVHTGLLERIAADGHNLPWKLAAVGPTTTSACRDLLGVEPAIVPKKFVAESLAEAMGDMHGQRVLLANADIARPVLHESLQQAGAQVDRVVAYCTVPATGGVNLPPLLAQGSIHAITFTSGSTVRSFIKRIGADHLDYARQAVIVCIGPIAAESATKAGLPPTVVAATYTEAGMVAALVDYAREHPLTTPAPGTT